MEHIYRSPTSSSSQLARPSVYLGSLRSSSASKSLLSSNDDIKKYRSSSKIRRMEIFHSKLEIVLLTTSVVVGFALISFTIIWWKKRRSSTTFKNINQEKKEQYAKDAPNPEDFERLPKIGSVLEGVLSYPEISIVQTVSQARSEDDTPSVVNSDVSSMWDSTSQQWDNNYFTESEKNGPRAPIRMLLSTVHSETFENQSIIDSEKMENINLDDPASKSGNTKKTVEECTRGSI